MTLRYYSSIAQDTTVSTPILAGTTTVPIAATTGWPLTYPFSLALDYGTTLEEIVDVTNVSGLNATITRGVDSTVAVAHSAGAVVRHVITARDIREANTHINASVGVHGVAGAVVGTTDIQPFTNKDLTDSTNKFNWPPVAGKNAIINGGMDIWQRGTSIALAASTGVTYLADRFCSNTGANQATTISRQATGDTTNLPNIQYALRHQRNSGQTGTGTLSLVQNIETVNSIPLAGKPVTLSFYARAGANYSSASNLLAVSIISSTGTDQNSFIAWVGSATPVSISSTLTTTWQRFTATGTIAATATQLALAIQFTPVGTAGANDYFEITGVQLELGSVATNFVRAGASIGGELALCQRYCQSLNVLNPNGTNGAYLAMGGGTGPSSATEFIIPLKVTMRIIPNLLSYLAINVSNGYAVVTTATLTISNHSTSDSLALNGGVTGALGSVYWLATSSASASNIIWSAEL